VEQTTAGIVDYAIVHVESVGAGQVERAAVGEYAPTAYVERGAGARYVHGATAVVEAASTVHLQVIRAGGTGNIGGALVVDRVVADEVFRLVGAGAADVDAGTGLKGGHAIA